MMRRKFIPALRRKQEVDMNTVIYQHNGTPHSNFFDTEGVNDMLMMLDLGPESHILLINVSTEVEMCLITENIKYSKVGWSSRLFPLRLSKRESTTTIRKQ
jgi:hypothetical protein